MNQRNLRTQLTSAMMMVRHMIQSPLVEKFVLAAPEWCVPPMSESPTMRRKRRVRKLARYARRNRRLSQGKFTG